MATRPRLTARTADRHRLYEISVQCPEADVSFIGRVFKREFGRPASSLREDFCGTALLCAEWVRSRRYRRAEGVDLDASVLAWARRNNIAPLGEAARRVRLVRANVNVPKRPLVDVQVAFNFSYCVFKKRRELVAYLRAARLSLNREGLFILDLHGGPESQDETIEVSSYPGFKYEWEQGPFNPVTSEATCHIHFRFPDGTRIRKAFTYEWRIWSIMELREAMEDAGFRETHVYWEGTDTGTGEGNGVYRRVRKADNDPSYVSYVLGVR